MSFTSINTALWYPSLWIAWKQFIPEPKVDSVVVSFKEKREKLPVKDFDFFERIVRDSFQFKRKNIKNNLKKYDLKKYVL